MPWFVMLQPFDPSSGSSLVITQVWPTVISLTSDFSVVSVFSPEAVFSLLSAPVSLVLQPNVNNNDKMTAKKIIFL